MTTASTPLGIGIDLTYDFLEEHWGDEAKCELNHTNDPCSVAATAIWVRCVPPKLVCANAVPHIVEVIAEATALCACMRPVTSHWSVIPV